MATAAKHVLILLLNNAGRILVWREDENVLQALFADHLSSAMVRYQRSWFYWSWGQKGKGLFSWSYEQILLNLWTGALWLELLILGSFCRNENYSRKCLFRWWLNICKCSVSTCFLLVLCDEHTDRLPLSSLLFPPPASECKGFSSQLMVSFKKKAVSVGCTNLFYWTVVSRE